jgi:hypothetical protein
MTFAAAMTEAIQCADRGWRGEAASFMARALKRSPYRVETEALFRRARCDCGAERPSSRALAFFEYRGDGSREAREGCAHCGYYRVAHERDESRVRPEPVAATLDHEFEPRGGQPVDGFYCGCRGWD